MTTGVTTERALDRAVTLDAGPSPLARRGRWLMHHPTLTVTTLLVAGWLFVGLTGPLLAPYSPTAQDFPRLTLPSAAHPLGTDPLGRDLLSRTLVGGRTALQIAFSSVVAAVALGTLVGLYSAFRGGLVDLFLQRLVDIMQCIPVIVLALLLVGIRGASRASVIFALVFVFTPTMIRVMRGSALVIRQMDYVLAARAVGARDSRLIFRHVLPNASSYAIVLGSVWMAQAIIVSASLSFLGLGVPPPTPDWGRMLGEDAVTYMLVKPWLVVPPILAIVTSVLAFNLFGDALRDLLYQGDR
jgi:peptide/nickel transport system permease protein